MKCSKCVVSTLKNNKTGNEDQQCVPKDKNVDEEAKKAENRGEDPPAVGCNCK